MKTPLRESVDPAANIITAPISSNERMRNTREGVEDPQPGTPTKRLNRLTLPCTFTHCFDCCQAFFSSIMCPQPVYSCKAVIACICSSRAGVCIYGFDYSRCG